MTELNPAVAIWKFLKSVGIEDGDIDAETFEAVGHWCQSKRVTCEPVGAQEGSQLDEILRVTRTGNFRLICSAGRWSVEAHE